MGEREEEKEGLLEEREGLRGAGGQRGHRRKMISGEGKERRGGGRFGRDDKGNDVGDEEDEGGYEKGQGGEKTD